MEETNRYYGKHCEILQTAHMANFEENVEEMVEMTREAAAVAGRDSGAATAGGGAAARRLVTRRRRPVE